MFKKCTLLRGLAVFALVPVLAYSAPAAGKVRSVLGSVERQKMSESEWKDLRMNANVFQSDKVRTGEASEVIFGLSDGSAITISEFTEVELSSLLQPNDKGGFETRIDINKGHLNFVVEKLKEKNSTFKFKTGTATASIRGTQGFVGGQGLFFAALKTGKLEIIPEGSSEPVFVHAGETTFGKDSLVVLKLASSGHPRFAAKLEKVFADSTKDMNALMAEVIKADSILQVELALEADSLAKASVPENGFTVKTPSPIEVCNEGLEVEGYYSTTDANATLTVKVGNGAVSNNLITATDGKSHAFTQKISISDDNNLWKADKATIEFSGAGVKTTKTIDLTVNRTCKDVNTRAPSMVLSSYDSLRCSANVSIGNMQNDAGVFSVEVDGSPMTSSAITRNTQERIKLKSGSHEYTLRAEDMAGNKAEVNRVMGCYPLKHFNVEVLGAANEKVTAPYNAPGASQRLVKTLQFRIKIPENKPEYLYKVIVKQNGKIILQETLSQIQNLDYQIPVELSRDLPNRIDIEVTHKSGFRAKAKKVYEVSPR